MVRQSDSERLTHVTRLSNWRKNSTLIATWHDVVESRSHMPCVWPNDRSRSGFKTGGWSGRRSTKWPPWMPCPCIKCIQRWHINTILTYRPWACISSDWNTQMSQKPDSSIDTVFTNKQTTIVITTSSHPIFVTQTIIHDQNSSFQKIRFWNLMPHFDVRLPLDWIQSYIFDFEKTLLCWIKATKRFLTHPWIFNFLA